MMDEDAPGVSSRRPVTRKNGAALTRNPIKRIGTRTTSIGTEIKDLDKSAFDER